MLIEFLMEAFVFLPMRCGTSYEIPDLARPVSSCGEERVV